MKGEGMNSAVEPNIANLTVYQNDPMRDGDVDWHLTYDDGAEFSGRILLYMDRDPDQIDWNETPEGIDWEEAEDKISEAAWSLYHSKRKSLTVQ